jgi:hypothetical protein
MSETPHRYRPVIEFLIKEAHLEGFNFKTFINDGENLKEFDDKSKVIDMLDFSTGTDQVCIWFSNKAGEEVVFELFFNEYVDDVISDYGGLSISYNIYKRVQDRFQSFE